MLQLHRLAIRTLGATVSRACYSTSIPKPDIVKDKKSDEKLNKKSKEKPIQSTYSSLAWLFTVDRNA